MWCRISSCAHPKAGVEPRVRLPERAPLVSADIALIQRVLQNLIENALKHTEDGGQVTIVVERAGSQVTVRVEDTGCGIPEADLQKVFERFYQADAEPDPVRESGATGGLGLAIVKKILDLHGSGVKVASTVGEGSAFWFSLPVST